MKTFEEYSRSFKIACNPDTLDFSTKDQEYCIYEGSGPLLTPGGKSFAHPSEELVRMLTTDLQLFDKSTLKQFSSVVLFAFRKDIFDAGDDAFHDQWDSHISGDPFVRIKSSGSPAIDPFSTDDPLFTFAFITLTGLIGHVNRFVGKIISESSMEESEANPFSVLLKLSYSGLSADQKIAVQALSTIHRSGIVLPLLLVKEEISALDYAKGLISLKLQPGEYYSDCLAGVAKVKSYLDIFVTRPGKELSTAALIREGEGRSVEFKSTLRWDIRAGKTNPAIERSCLKTISAFLNSTGGSLLIGIRDDGSVEGIETDKFANEDKFLLHLWTLIRICLGRDFSPFIRTRIEKADEKSICVVDCRPSNRPVFLRQPGFPEEMYIRVGPSSNAVDISEALKYIADRFQAR